MDGVISNSTIVGAAECLIVGQRLLEDMLPMAAGRVSHITLRRHTLKVGARLEQRVERTR